MTYNNNSLIQDYYTVFPDLNKFTQLAPEVWVYNNFITKQECKTYIEEAKDINDEKFNNGLKTIQLKSLALLTSRFNDIMLGKNWYHDDFIHFKKNIPGQAMVPHIDILGWQNDLFKNGLVSEKFDGLTEKHNYAAYSTLLYFNENYVGGEISYPEYNLHYKPKAGDLVLHSVEVIHAVKKVLGGDRYACQSNINQSYTFDKNFMENYKFPDLNKVYGVDDTDGDFQYSIRAHKIINKRLRDWSDSKPDLSAYESKI
jgi:predicted 2-oxoglutarate/Fe(II)-dependent dioxygenase YbiX